MNKWKQDIWFIRQERIGKIRFAWNMQSLRYAKLKCIYNIQFKNGQKILGKRKFRSRSNWNFLVFKKKKKKMWLFAWEQPPGSNIFMKQKKFLWFKQKLVAYMKWDLKRIPWSRTHFNLNPLFSIEIHTHKIIKLNKIATRITKN